MDDDIKAVIRAQGRALMLLCTMLESRETIPHGEYGKALALLSVVTSEIDEDAGLVLGALAGLVQEGTAAVAAPH